LSGDVLAKGQSNVIKASFRRNAGDFVLVDTVGCELNDCRKGVTYTDYDHEAYGKLDEIISLRVSPCSSISLSKLN